VACEPSHPSGFKLQFTQQSDGGVAADFACGDYLEGYPGWLHGGVISLLFDSAMANCMFAQGHRAVTAELTVQFKAPVATGRTARITANVQRDLYPLYLLRASLVQDDAVKATATAKFMVSDGAPEA
jgi:acyl-coenzyme A thioesterase PaaI-like protein